MLLKTLRLRNYRKYKNASIEFPDGVTGIIGLNGVGKTTLIEAIGWVLFGHHAARTTKKFIKRGGASHQESCSVSLEFELENDEYRVMREMIGKNLVSKASLMINGKLITENADEVTAVITKNIGMDYPSFFTSVFTRQKELNAFSNLRAAERKKLVLRMLGIERIEKSIQAIREDKRGKEKRIEGIKVAAYDREGRKKIDLLTDRRKELEQAQEELLRLVKEIEAATRLKEETVEVAKKNSLIATQKYELYVALSSKLSERRSELENTKKRSEEKEKELADLLVSKKRLEEIADEERRYFLFREQKEQLDTVRAKYQQKQELVKREKKTLHELQRREESLTALKQQKINLFDGVEDKAEALKSEIVAKQKEREQLHASLGALKSQLLQIRKDIEESTAKKKRIKDLGPKGECPLCERQIGTDYEWLLTKLEEGLQAMKRNHQSVFTAYKRKKEELASQERDAELLLQRAKEVDKQVMAMRALDTRIIHEERELAHWQRELKEVKTALTSVIDMEFDATAYNDVITELKNLETVYREILGLRTAVGRIDAVKNNLQTVCELEERTSEAVRDLQRQIDDLAFDKQDYDEKKASYDRKREELTESKLKLLAKRNEFENIRRDVEHVLSDIEEQKRLLEEKEKEETAILYLSVLEKLITDFKAYMVGRIRPILSDYASDMLRRLTDGKYSAMELDENYDLFIYDGGTAFELNRFSGGEEDLANLCLRLAISAVVTDRSAIETNFIILDEIFGSQDDLRRRNIMQMLNRLSNKFRQIFLISHIEEMQDYMEYVFHVTEDETGVSWVRMVK
ncbi:MAG: SMC family ATPase [Methanophagales archaeon]|nr:SMC family ATPase [Methanophagales archaeon]